MTRTFRTTLTILALSASATAFAQQAPAPAAAKRGTTVAPVAQGATPAPAAAKAVDSGIDPTDANITIEITVTDKAAGSGAAPTTRSGTITVANQSNSSVRGLSSVYSGNNGTKLDPVGLDIDARAVLRKSGMVSATLTVAYIPTGVEPIMSSAQRQQATLFLKPGQETQVLTTGMMTGQGPAVRITAKAIVNK